MSSHRVDWAALRQALEMAADIRQMSMRDIADELGISPSGLTRLRQGHALEADALVSLVAWLFPSKTPTWVVKR